MYLIKTLIIFIKIDPASLLLEKKGLKIGITISTITLIIGSILTLFINHNYYIFLMGHIIATIGSPFRFNSIAKFAA
jgi:hypothetical protein